MSTILELAVASWQEVRSENERDKELVAPEERKQWEDFEAKTTARIKAIIEGYDGSVLSDTDKDWLSDLEKTIKRAQRVSREDLEEKKRLREEAEAARIEDERLRKEAEEAKKREVAETKKALLGKLGF